MPQLSTSDSVGWFNHDSWSETYLGARWLVENELPEMHWQTLPHHGPLSQMVLIASHHLVEITLFACIRTVLQSAPGRHPKHEKKLVNVRFKDAFTKWPAELLSTGFDLSVEPYKSAAALQKRRNDTIHKESALTTLLMARSALVSAVGASRAISLHMLGKEGFKYEAVLRKYPLDPQPWFSDVPFPQ